MKNICDILEERLAAEGLEKMLEDSEAYTHIAGCKECSAVVESIGQVEAVLRKMPLHDAPEELRLRTKELVAAAAGYTVSESEKKEQQQRYLTLPDSLLKRLSQANFEGSKKYSVFIAAAIGLFAGLHFLISLYRGISLKSVIKLLEGSAGAITMITATLLAVAAFVYASLQPKGKKNFAVAGTFLSLALILFSVRSMSSLFFRVNYAAPVMQKQGAGSEGFSDLVVAFKSDIERGKKDREEMSDVMLRTKNELADYREKSTGIFEKLVSKFESLSREVDQLAAVSRKENSTELPAPEKGQGMVQMFPESPPLPAENSPQVEINPDAPAPIRDMIDTMRHAGTVSQDEGKFNKYLSKERNLEPGAYAKLSSSEGAWNTSGEDRSLSSSGGKRSEEVDKRFKEINGMVANKGFELEQKAVNALPSPAPTSAQSNSKAQEFYALQSITTDIKFKDASGYWANTYLPGDPAVRRLKTAMLVNKPKALSGGVQKIPALHEGVQQVAQPFDVPANSALGLYLHGDRQGAGGSSRMLLQVGLKGAKRTAGARPAMKIGLVFDLRGELSEEEINEFKEVALALHKAKSPGDRISVYFAGRSEESRIPAEKFSYGYLSLELPKVLAKAQGGQKSELSLSEALAAAMTADASKIEEDAPLDSSMLLLVSSQPFGQELQQIQTLAASSAVNGVPLSVIGVGRTTVESELEKIALDGQGQLLSLKLGQDPKAIIDSALCAISKVVARALRLRIRLASGVKLVDVIGSYRLNHQRSVQVKEAEKSIDRRVAKSLGIAADRGDDEEGIQIFIPAFYSEDEHVILLDLVVAGPGAVADVRLRYKDLVNLKNSVAAASFSLSKSESIPGRLEQNVLKNFLALQLSSTFEEASRLLSQGDNVRALQLTSSYQSFLQSVKEYTPGLLGDAEVESDVALLADYLALLKSQSAKSKEMKDYLANSLALAGKLKISSKVEDK